MDIEIRKKILELIHIRPHAISEIAEKINKNWRTADKYVQELSKEDLVRTHVFRKGGRGALKVVYWLTLLSENPSSVKNFLLQRILQGTKKQDFSALDILQNVSKEKRKITLIEKESYHKTNNLEDFWELLKKAENQILFLSGNLTFMYIGDKVNDFLELFKKKLEEGVNIYFLTRVDESNKEIIQKLLQINKSSKKGKIEVRYAQHPLRCTIIDEKEFHIKENLISSDIKDTFIYHVYDKSWIKWITDIFWHIWHGSIDAEKRLEVLKSVRKR